MVNAQSTAYYTITVLLDPQQEGGLYSNMRGVARIDNRRRFGR